MPRSSPGFGHGEHQTLPGDDRRHADVLPGRSRFSGVAATPVRVAGLDMGVSVVRMRTLWTADVPTNVPNDVHKQRFLVPAISSLRRPYASQQCRSQPRHVSVWTSLWTSPAKKEIDPSDREGGQGLRSRGGHVWPPCLDGPDTFTDTMDEAGPPGPAWKRLCLSPDRVGQGG